VRFLGASLLVLLTLLGVWLASSLVAYAGGPAWLACVGGVLLFPVLPLWWEHRATEAFYAQLKRATRLLPKKRALTGFTRVALRTVVINVVFLGALLALWPKVVFAALVTRGDWFLPPDAPLARKVILATASGLEWVHEAANDNPYRTKQDEQQPVPDTVKPVVATITTPHGSGARWRRPEPVIPEDPSPEPPTPGLSELVEDRPTAAWTVGQTSWPWPSTVHPVVSGMTASDETSPESVSRYISSRVTDPFQRVKALHDWVVTRLRYDSAALRGPRPPQDARSVFDARKGVCEGYARLLVELGKHSGDRIVYVTGEVREEDGSLAPIGHAWNAVEVHGAWYLLDATWDDPVMSDGSDTYRTDYLFIPPKLALMNHFPDEPSWQLEARALSRAEFLRQPPATVGLAREGLELVSPPVVGDALELTLRNPAKVFVMIEVKPEGTKCGPSDEASLALSCPVTASSERAVVYVNGQRDGSYGSVATFSLER
jgi:transglutaminase-like putative cysteine protease